MYAYLEPPSEEEIQLEEQWIQRSGGSMLPEGKASILIEQFFF